MSICCIEGCAGPKDEKEIYFEFPTSRLLRKRWLDAMKTAKVPPDSRVCCRHFAPHDYELVRGKVRLRSKVVPTIFDGEVANDDTETSQESTETAESSSTIIDNKSKTEKLKSNHNYNENSHNDAEKSDNDVEKSHNDVGRSDNDVEKSHSDVEKSHNDVEKSHNDVENSHNDVENSHNDIENSHNDVEKPCNDVEKPDKDNVHNEKEKETDKADTNKENSTENNEKENINNGKENEESQNNRKRNNADNVSEKEKRSRKTRFKVTPKRVVKPPPDLSEDSSNSSDNREESTQPDSSKEDIEGILTHYYIENKKTERQVAAMADVIQSQCNEVQCSEPPPSAPVFIELSVGQEAGQIPSNDCLMVLESVQCEVDPELLLATRGDDDCEKYEIDDDDDEPDDKKHDPISLLTSSDEDDVIIEEPKIDTVEVSSADTDEDDIPLVKLVKPPSKTGQHRYSKSKANIITKLLWGGSDFYCAKCRFTTLSASEYTKHMHSHSKVMQLCQDCGFTTSSKVQLSRHKQKHKNEKRFKCALCNYSAKHNMSLMYHMKTHKSIRNIEMAVCNIYKNKVSGRKKSLSKRHSCGDCDYTTDRVSDLKRHRVRRHRDYEGDDEDYAP